MQPHRALTNKPLFINTRLGQGLIAGVVVAFGLVVYLMDDKPKSPEQREAKERQHVERTAERREALLPTTRSEFTASASSLEADYAENVVAAATKYEHRPAVVYGLLQEVALEGAPVLFIQSGDPERPIKAKMHVDATAWVATLRSGQQVKVRCDFCKGREGRYVTVGLCKEWKYDGR